MDRIKNEEISKQVNVGELTGHTTHKRIKNDVAEARKEEVCGKRVIQLVAKQSPGD